MVGLIWLIQIVHYPLFKLVGKNEFQVYHNGHSVLITPLVGTVMIIELISSILLVVFPPKNVSLTIPIIGVILVFIIWASTAFLQIPQHNALANAYELKAHNLLVQTNWIRTIAWSMRDFITLHAPLVSNPTGNSSLKRFLDFPKLNFTKLQVPVSGRTIGHQDVLYPTKDGHNLE
ncbi:MAG: hypothetical protein CM15mP45_15720 [Deltaproteobacteria bacterium]|nr:MAG: hypothetical protein CM15mP45_15720 [Deltaproteobacteria bacterium]